MNFNLKEKKKKKEKKVYDTIRIESTKNVKYSSYEMLLTIPFEHMYKLYILFICINVYIFTFIIA